MNEDQLQAAEPFLRAIAERREDSLPWLIFADWLGELGFWGHASFYRMEGETSPGLLVSISSGPEEFVARQLQALARPDPEPVRSYTVDEFLAEMRPEDRPAVQAMLVHLAALTPPPLSWWRLLLRFLRRCHDRAVQARG
jgi:uncharacterized protein (TIGR02996 family)